VARAGVVAVLDYFALPEDRMGTLRRVFSGWCLLVWVQRSPSLGLGAGTTAAQALCMREPTCQVAATRMPDWPGTSSPAGEVSKFLGLRQ